MHYEVDTHTHTIASGHAYNTLMEMVQAAADKGLKALAVTDHTRGVPGHEMFGAPAEVYFRNYHVIPRDINGVHLLMGAEVNILNGGTVDLSEKALRRQEAELQRKKGKKGKGQQTSEEPSIDDSLSLGGFIFPTKKIKGIII